MDQHDAKVHHIRVGKAGLEQCFERFKEMVGIMPISERLGVDVPPRHFLPEFFIGPGAGGIGGAVFAIGSAAQEGDPF